jgi:5'(3')-deoxyribonucleotidase
MRTRTPLKVKDSSALTLIVQLPRSQFERLKIAVDLDGVLAETMEAWCKRANEFLGTSFKLADLDTWASWRKLGISREQFFQFLDEAWDDWESIPPTEPRLAEKVRKIARSGQIDVVTGRSKESVTAAKSWLAEHKIPYQRFVRVPGWKDKIFLNYDVYIDDAPELMPLISRNPKMWGILYSRPWNRTVPELRQVFRVESWTEISKLLEKIQR